MKTKVLFLFLPLLLTGCLERSADVVPLELSSDKEDVFAVADIFTGDGELSKTIKITSNRSWSAHLNDIDNPIDESDPDQSVPWATLSVEEHPNISRVTDEVEVTVNFNRNYSEKQINGVLHIYSEGELRKSIPLTQDGAKYFLRVDTDPECLFSDGGGLFNIDVVSNVKWTATLDPSSTADVVPVVMEGTDSGVLQFRLRSNDDPVEKTVKFTIFSEGLGEMPVEMKQRALDPNMKTFKVYAKFAVSGTYRNSTPVVVLAPELMDPEVVAAGPKFYYKAGVEGFTEDLIPDTTSSEVPSEGIPFASMFQAYSNIYIDIYAVCEGYRDTYTRVYCRHWRTAVGYTEKPENGLLLSVTWDTSRTKASVWNMTNKLQTLGTMSTMDGTACAYYLAHNLTKEMLITFLIDGEPAGSKQYESDECGSTKPLGLVSKVLPVKEGGLICFEVTNKQGPYLHSFASLEQAPFKP